MICNYQKEHIFLIVREAWNSQVSLYIPLMWYCNTPIPSIYNTSSTIFLSGRIFNPLSVQNPLVRVEICDPVSTRAVISTPFTLTPVSFAHPKRCSKGFGLLFLDSVTSLPVFTGAPGFPIPCGSFWGRLEALLPPPASHLKEYLDIHKPNSPTLSFITFNPLVITSFTIFPILTLLITIFLITQLSEVTDCSTLGLLHHQYHLYNLLTQLHDIILPFCLN